MLKAVIFDFDGVIVDSETKKFNDLTFVLKEYNLHINFNDFQNFIGKKRGFFLKQKFDLPDNKIRKIMENIRNLDMVNIKNYKLIKGIKELLIFLYSKKIKIVITTGSKKLFVQKILEEYNLTKYFDFIISGELFIKSKPDSECYQITMDKLEINHKDCVIIEDSIAGVLAAKKTNIPVWGLTTYYTNNELKADKFFKDHAELLNYLQQIKLFLNLS